MPTRFERLRLSPSASNFELRETIKMLCHDLDRAVVWDASDFESRAKDMHEDDWDVIYDPKKFDAAALLMIKEHDCNNGITWDTIDLYLDEYCKR